MTTFYPPVLCRGHSFGGKMAQKVKMIFNFDFLSLKTIFNIAEESAPFCNHFNN